MYTWFDYWKKWRQNYHYFELHGVGILADYYLFASNKNILATIGHNNVVHTVSFTNDALDQRR